MKPMKSNITRTTLATHFIVHAKHWWFACDYYDRLIQIEAFFEHQTHPHSHTMGHRYFTPLKEIIQINDPTEK
jgi:hypothetical protein